MPRRHLARRGQHRRPADAALRRPRTRCTTQPARPSPRPPTPSADEASGEDEPPGVDRASPPGSCRTSTRTAESRPLPRRTAAAAPPGVGAVRHSGGAEVQVGRGGRACGRTRPPGAGAPAPLPASRPRRVTECRGSRLAIADAGLSAVHSRLVVAGGPGRRGRAARVTLDAPTERPLRTVEVTGEGATGELTLPYRGRTLRGVGVRRARHWSRPRRTGALHRRGVRQGCSPRSGFDWRGAPWSCSTAPRWDARAAAAVGRNGRGRQPAAVRDLGARAADQAHAGGGRLLVPVGEDKFGRPENRLTQAAGSISSRRCPQRPTGWVASVRAWRSATTCTPTAAPMCGSPRRRTCWVSGSHGSDRTRLWPSWRHRPTSSWFLVTRSSSRRARTPSSTGWRSAPGPPLRSASRGRLMRAPSRRMRTPGIADVVPQQRT